MDANIINEENHHQHAAADARRRLARRRRRLELITVLQKAEDFPSRSENKTDELVETFLENLEDDVHDMICEGGHDDGLDSDRDTEAEVETVLRLFPDVMTRDIEILYYEDDGYDDADEEEVTLFYYPIQLLAVTFPRLAIELGLFDEQQRGGLLSRGGYISEGEGHPVLHYLMRSDPIERCSQEHNEHIDDTYLQVLIQLRKMGLLKKEDIQMYNLLNGLFVPEKRFRFLVAWDPSALTHTNKNGYLPIHSPNYRYSIRGFKFVFEYGIHYFPKKKGINLLFRKSNYGSTPFQHACCIYGHEQVMEVVEDNLARYSTSLDNHAPPFNIVEALMMAAIDENVHLDSVYFLIRREPDILQKLLASSSLSSIESATNSNQRKRKRNDIIYQNIMDEE
ncbi:hypothetical protein FRACYDRAFT_243419 [Fragilariopsis cylindrus CCMP1102]|uniref:Uncharacterized protein n=1 Tax=Fragilariopsis cylindrus CCMP1102 TaxID=635003 RepID=A0A1E7F4C8_9STRA|nr:hypothetical protein FRACYDRAFT_243419 [Fragilariopsis cylindrus CCMP1102]|eukprot:OEU12999.1 hypothetical protein FRACYDRAFT_243419 [Fragilariopsis cylindrus CCMP1102]